MLTFILTILFRLFSGIKNAEYYKHGVITNADGSEGSLPYKTGVVTAVIIMTILDYFWMSTFQFPLNLLILLPLIPVWYMMVGVMFKGKSNRVHFWENVIHPVWFIVGLVNNADLIALCLGSWVGNVLFNWAIQYYRTGNFTEIWNRTVYKRTELIQLGNLSIYKPRIQNGYLLVLSGALCLIGYILIWYLTSWQFSLSTIIGWF